MILKGFIETDLYTEVGKARNYFNTIASNSISNTDRCGAPPVRHRVHSAILKPESLDLLTMSNCAANLESKLTTGAVNQGGEG